MNKLQQLLRSLIMYFVVWVCFVSFLDYSAASFSRHPAITKITKQTPEYSHSVAVHWYFPEYAYGEYANTTRVYSCRYTDAPQNFIYDYELVLTLKPEFAKIYYSAEIADMPEGNVCFQICAFSDDTLERCSEPFKFENKINEQSPPKSFPIFWDENKYFRTYPYILKLQPIDSLIEIEWYFPQHQASIFPKTFVYSCQFSPEDLSFSNRELVTEIDTREQNIHRARIPNISVRWVCAVVCVVSHYFVCGEPAKLDNHLFLSGRNSILQSHSTTDPSSTLPYTPSGDEDWGNSDSYDLVFDDYEDFDSYFEQSQPGMTNPRKDSIMTGNYTSNSACLLSTSLFVVILTTFVICVIFIH